MNTTLTVLEKTRAAAPSRAPAHDRDAALDPNADREKDRAAMPDSTLRLDRGRESQNDRDSMASLYERTFPGVASFVGRMGGSFEDARDIFHDALIIFGERKRRAGPSRVRSSEGAYIYGIAKHLWIRKHTRDSRIVSLTPFERTLTIPPGFFPTVEEGKLVRLLESAGRRCMELLRAVYYRKKSLSAVANDLGYANGHALSVRKHKCLEKVRDTVKTRGLQYEDFIS